MALSNRMLLAIVEQRLFGYSNDDGTCGSLSVGAMSNVAPW
jgi:hypothetical protein